MDVWGSKIKARRVEQGISQEDLVAGICRPTVLQMIETRNRCDSRAILTAICKRLELEVEDCLDYTDEEKVVRLLKQIEVKCSHFEHQEAYKLLSNYDIGEMQQNIVVMSQYYYYLGITNLVGANDSSLALSYFNKVLEYGDNLNIYSILSVSALGSVYEGQKQWEKAKICHEKSLILLKSYKGEEVSMSYKIYFNSARFYSELKDYQRSIEICQKAISLNDGNGTFHYLESLYYELGFNKHMAGENGMLEYKTAYYLARCLKNKKLMKVILSDAERYDLTFKVDENGVI